MEPKFIPYQVESNIYAWWEKNGFFEATANLGKDQFSIILPPPNANADLHLGHAMYVYEDIMMRYNKFQGKECLWVPGADHAGFETQFVYEKHLLKQGKSRFDFDRETLFQDIWKFVMKNRETMENQLRRLGFALDWSKKQFTMDPEIVTIVYETFKRLFEDGLVYRSERLVNYCTKDGTSFSDLEVLDKESEGTLYFIKYLVSADSKVKNSDTQKNYIVVATTRPETLFGDVAVMVHPTDKRYLHLIGATVSLPLTNREIPVIADEYVDKKFGTGAVKVTPSHDFNDNEVGKRHGLSHPPVIGFDGKMKNTDIVDEQFVKKARIEVVRLLTEKGYIEKTTPHKMVLKTCYKCGMTLEPLPLEQWFVKVRPLADKAVEAIKEKEVQFVPKKFEKRAVEWLDKFHDWNISRQIVWGIRIPAYKCKNKNQEHSEQSTANSQQRTANSKQLSWFVSVEKPDKCQICGNCEFEQDTDTFDTWFSSGQWPFATLKRIDKQTANSEQSTIEKKSFFDRFYPTTVMETGYDILPWWVVRMLMLGIYATGKVPFKHVFLHGLVRDKQGQKMSKSKGNVVNPLEMVDKYGADALRASLIFGTSEGNDVPFAEEKVVGMRNFANKLWNIGRLIYLNQNTGIKATSDKSEQTETILTDMKKELNTVEKKYHLHMKKFQFTKALGLLYEFIWHRFADYYLEQLKEETRNGNIDVLNDLKAVYFGCLTMLHPFMPFVTEAVWKVFHGEESSVLKTRKS